MNIIKKSALAPRRIDLFSEFGRDLDQVFNEVFGAPFLHGRKSKGHPLLDVIRSDGSLTFQYAVPGVKLEDLNIEITEDQDNSKILSVSGKLSSDYSHKDDYYHIRELSSQEFRRCIRLPEDIAQEDPVATLKDGVLRLVFKTHVEPEPQPSVKKIQVKSE
jgi:HSP20 family molecular chaperone IbpA